jgi:hypothetical protein
MGDKRQRPDDIEPGIRIKTQSRVEHPTTNIQWPPKRGRGGHGNAKKEREVGMVTAGVPLVRGIAYSSELQKVPAV